MSSLILYVPGVPVAQGSKRHVGRGIMVESAKQLQPWREAVIAAARRKAGTRTFFGPVKVDCVFTFPRPKSHFGTGRNAQILKKDAPTFKASAPDIDKLCRAILDALVQAGVLRDDALVFALEARKIYGERPSAQVVILEA